MLLKFPVKFLITVALIFLVINFCYGITFLKKNKKKLVAVIWFNNYTCTESSPTEYNLAQS